MWKYISWRHYNHGYVPERFAKVTPFIPIVFQTRPRNDHFVLFPLGISRGLWLCIDDFVCFYFQRIITCFRGGAILKTYSICAQINQIHLIWIYLPKFNIKITFVLQSFVWIENLVPYKNVPGKPIVTFQFQPTRLIQTSFLRRNFYNQQTSYWKLKPEIFQTCRYCLLYSRTNGKEIYSEN